MRLNNKGYLLVEVVLAGFLTFIMAYFLINITLKLKDRNTDINVETKLLNDKTIITNEIMSDIMHNKITSVSAITNGISISYGDGTSKDLVYENNTITYGSYSKKLNDNAICNSIEIKIEDNYFSFNLPITTKYSTKDYGINIFGFIG